MDWLKKLDPLQFSLAPIKYEKIIAEAWPVASFEIVELKDSFGRAIFECYSTLDTKLKNQNKKLSQIYGPYDGTGTAPTKSLAVYKSFSEALERWACYSIATETQHSHHPLEKTLSSTGFASFPSLSSTRARENARYEAIERWCINNWWQGKLGLMPVKIPVAASNLFGWEIVSPFKKAHTLIVRQILEARNGCFAFYGFATSNSKKSALERAIIELDRNRRAILLKTGGDPENLDHTNISLSTQDRRLFFFSTEIGNQLFNETVGKTNGPKSLITIPPQLLIDHEIKGPWSRYTRVWRCLFEYNEPLTDDVSVFFF